MSQLVKVSRELRFARGGRNGSEAAPIWTVDVYNNSGGALARGDVVVWQKASSTADLIYVTTTTTTDDVNVLGMVYETIAAGAVGKCQIWGPTDALKVNGITDIAIGDVLSTYSVAKIAQKGGVSGLFAVALEAYTANDSSGVLDAFLTGGMSLPAGVGTHTHASNAQGGVTLSGVTMSGTWGGQPTWQSAQTMTLTTPTIASFANATHTHANAAGGGNTLTIPTIADFTNATHNHSNAAGGGVTLTGVTLGGTIGGQPTWQSAQTMTLTTPTIADFTNATHNHSNAAGGGVTLSGVTMSGTWSGQPTFNSSQTFVGATISSGYNLKVGGTAAHGTTAGTNLISIFLGTAPTGTLASGGSLYVTTSTNVEVNWLDSGGSVTQLSAS